tara:strand:- start:205 stop:456 length:252 start_codon:yes stop_codon:yes gene_type:complete
MSDCKEYSDDDLFDMLDHLKCEWSYLLDNEDKFNIEKVIGNIMKELDRRDYWKKDEIIDKPKDDFKGAFDGRDEGDDGLDLPF